MSSGPVTVTGNTGPAPNGGAGRRRRRRKRGPNRPADASSEGDRAGTAPAAREERPDGPRSKRRGKNGGKRTPSVLERVERAISSEPVPSAVDAESPLTPQEKLELKQRLSFLREYKKILKLKLNAQEDLLVEGAREPESRGVTHHLLSKVDYGTVQRALERLPVNERPRLIGGVLDFRPELPLLLLYLESLDAAGHAEATRALEGALERIDWTSVTEGQMRRVLDLVVDLFPQGRRASLLLGLLENRSFRSAFDQSLAKLPEALAELVVPVRALEAVVLEGKANPSDPAMLRLGLELALRDGVVGLERRPPRVKARFIETVARSAPLLLDANFGSVQRLLSSFDEKSAERRGLDLLVVRALLASGQLGRAGQRMRDLARRYPDDAEVAALEEALAAPRFGRVALLRGGPMPPVEHLNEGVILQNQRPVWLRVAAGAQVERLEPHVSLHRSLRLPAVARLLGVDSSDGNTVVVLERRGSALLPSHPALRKRTSALDVALQVITLARSLAKSGLALPELGARRFEVQLDERAERAPMVILVNTFGLQQAENAEERMLAASRRLPFLARHLLDEELARLTDASDFDTLEDTLDELRWGSLVSAPPR